MANGGCGGGWLGGGLGGEGRDLAGLAAFFDDEIAARESANGVIATIADDYPDFHEAGFGLEDVLRARGPTGSPEGHLVGWNVLLRGQERGEKEQDRQATDGHPFSLTHGGWGLGQRGLRQRGQQRHAQAFCAHAQ